MGAINLSGVVVDSLESGKVVVCLDESASSVWESPHEDGDKFRAAVRAAAKRAAVKAGPDADRGDVTQIEIYSHDRITLDVLSVEFDSPDVTDEDVRALKQEAAQAGDDAQVSLCDRALAGDSAAMAKCESAIRNARAQ
jgi:hypothetical protein